MNYYATRQHTVYSLPSQGHQYQYWSKQADQKLQKDLLNQFAFLKNDAAVPTFQGYACHHTYTTKNIYGVNLALGSSNLHVYTFICDKILLKTEA